MQRSYCLRPKCVSPQSDEDYEVIERRHMAGGKVRERKLDPGHHAYRDFIAHGGAPEIERYEPRKRIAEPAPLTLDEARDAAVQRLMPEYLAAIARWDAWGETKKGDALVAWRARVDALARELVG